MVVRTLEESGLKQKVVKRDDPFQMMTQRCTTRLIESLSDNKRRSVSLPASERRFLVGLCSSGIEGNCQTIAMVNKQLQWT